MIENGDCLKLFPTIKDESVDLIFADPPFNINYEYDEYKDKVDSGKYEHWTRSWIYQCHRVLKQNGTIWVAINDENAALLWNVLNLYFDMRNWVIWHYTFGNNCKTKFGRCHTHLLYFVKGKGFTFNSDNIRVESERQRMGDKRANPKGKVPSDVWTFSRVCGTFKERTGFHGCQMPEALLERIIKACSNENELVLDPFSGSGTTGVACKKLNRKFTGFELSSNYTELANKRIKDSD